MNSGGGELHLRVTISADPALTALIQNLADALRQAVDDRLAAADENSVPARDEPAAVGGAIPSPAGGVRDDPFLNLSAPAEQTPVPVLSDAKPVAGKKEGHPPASGTGKKWSDERILAMAQMRADGALWGAVWAAVNALDGPVITTAHACEVRYFLLKREGKLPNVAKTPAVATGDKAPLEKPDLSVLATKFKTKFRQPAAPRDPGGVVVVTVDQAMAWAAPRGLCNGVGARLDLAAVNAKRVQLGEPQFELAGRR